MLTDTQKAQIRLYLGYSDVYRYKHYRLESILTNLSPEAEILIADALAKLATIETTLLDAGTNGAGVKRVDEIWFFGAFERTGVIRNIGRQYVSRISITVGVPVYSDVFGKTGYLGDSFSPGGARYGNGSFYGLG